MKKLFALFFTALVLFANESFVVHTIHNKDLHITVTDDGIKVAEYPDRVIILDFFGKNCPPCQIMIPRIIDLQRKMPDKVQIIGMHVQDPLDMYDLKRFEEIGINYPVVDYLTNKDNQRFILYIAQLVGWDGSIPFMLFFDRNGNYVKSHLGLASEEELVDDVTMYYLSVKPKANAQETNTTKNSTQPTEPSVLE